MDLAHEVVAIQNLVDDAQLLALLERDEIAFDHQLDRAGFADHSRQALGAARAGQNSEVDLGQADLAGVLLGDHEVGGHRDLETTADGVAVECRDHQLGRLLEPVEGLVGVQAEVVLEVRVRLLEHVDVGAGAEELLAQTGQHDDVNICVEPGGEDRVVELAHHLVGVGVGRWVAEGQIGDAVLDLVVN